MQANNPYTPSEADSGFREREKRVSKTSIFRMIGIVFIVGVLGSVFFARFVRGPGDPTGTGIGFGIGGSVGLVLNLLWERLQRRNKGSNETKVPGTEKRDWASSQPTGGDKLIEGIGGPRPVGTDWTFQSARGATEQRPRMQKSEAPSGHGCRET